MFVDITRYVAVIVGMFAWQAIVLLVPAFVIMGLSNSTSLFYLAIILYSFGLYNSLTDVDITFEIYVFNIVKKNVCLYKIYLKIFYLESNV